jgi:serine/threonine protein kinase/GTPase SAR1 family protein
MGAVLTGRYHLVRRLGSGGFGQTFLAHDNHLPGQPICVVKQLKPRSSDPRSLEIAKRLFDLEAQTLYRLGTHPQIPQLLAHFEQAGEFYLVQDYVEGMSLNRVLAQRRQLREAEVIALMWGILQVLAFVHQQNVIHRDIKPSNLIWRKSDRKIVLIDFGAVKQVSTHILDRANQTSFTVAIGSPGYMPVEQHSSQPRFSSDIYAVGMLALQALTGISPGELPTDPQTGEFHCALLGDSLTIRPDLAVILNTMVRYDHRQRYQNAADALRSLAQLSRQEPVDAVRPAPSAQRTHLNGHAVPAADLKPTPLQTVPPQTILSQTVASQAGFSQTVNQDQERAIVSPPLTRQEYRNRQALLSKGRNYWVKGVLETSLHDQVLITLGLENRPNAVASPWNVALETDRRPPKTLPPGTQIVSIFDQIGVGRTLLILGEPGSGKTTTLLQLTRDLLARAEEDIGHLIPVVLNLSSWSGGNQSIADWVVDELNSKYQVPKKVGQPWLDRQQLLLLLDGLDEVRLDHRDACIAALNAFQQDYSAEMVVCSRIRDYEALSHRLNFQRAVYLRPLTPAQVQDYLDRLTVDLTGLKTLLADDPALQELAQSPLMLTIMVLAYQGVTADEMPIASTVEERRRQLFDTYIERMFRRREIAQHYSRTQTTHWLSWLARKLIQQSQTVFLIERLQPAWLDARYQKTLYRLIVAFLAGISLGFSQGLISQLGIGLMNTFQHGSPNELMHRLVNGLIIGLVIGPITGLAVGFFQNEIKPVETLKWSWKAARKGLICWAIAGFLIGLIGGAIVGLVNLLVSGVEPRDLVKALLGEIRPLDGWMGLIGGSVYGLTGGLGGLDIETRSTPNQAIRMSAASARIFALVGALVGGLAGGLLGSFTGDFMEALIYGFSVGLVFGLIGGGGLACVDHFALRLILFCKGYIPWNLTRFLNYATDRIFLQRVGGGYIFVHRLLMEHFAQEG